MLYQDHSSLNMGGRFQSRGGGGRGRGRNGSRMSNASSASTSGKKKTLADHVFYIGTAKQASDFVSAKLFLINHIREKFDVGMLYDFERWLRR